MAARLNITLVEDNDALRTATQAVLEREGHRVLAVSMAEDVDDTPATAPVDAYVIDLNLPGEDGIQLAQRLREAQPSAIIVMVTARSRLEDRLAGYNTGADAYLTKPIDPQELIAVLQSCIRRANLRADQTPDTLWLDQSRSLLIGDNGRIEMTHTEMMLAVALTRAPGRRLERWQAMQIIDPKDKGLSTSSLEMRITSLRRKLTAAGATDRPIRAIHGWGYMLCCRLMIAD